MARTIALWVSGLLASGIVGWMVGDRRIVSAQLPKADFSIFSDLWPALWLLLAFGFGWPRQ